MPAFERYGRDSARDSYNGTPCKECVGERSNGYGVVRLQYDSMEGEERCTKAAHRAAWNVYKNEGRELPRALVIRHQCQNKGCFNVDHLLTGTHRENMEDRKRAGRDELCGPKKKREFEELSPEEIEQIRGENDNVPYLARKYNIEWNIVLKIKGRPSPDRVEPGRAKKKASALPYGSPAVSQAQRLIDRIRARQAS